MNWWLVGEEIKVMVLDKEGLSSQREAGNYAALLIWI